MKVTRDFEPADRYVYDTGLCSTANGFAQVDTKQDAWYYGTWASPTRFAIVTYCEGDVTLQQAENAEEFVRAMRELVEWADKMVGPLRIDPGFNAELKEAFVALGLGDLLH